MFESQVLPTIPEEVLKTTEADENDINIPTFIERGPSMLQINENLITSEPLQFEFERKMSSEDNTIMVTSNRPIMMTKPTVRFETTLSVNLHKIKEIFEKICKKRGYDIVDDEGDQVTAVNKKVHGLKDLLFSCLSTCSRSYQNLTAIRLHSKTNKITCMRRITLKALIGDMRMANAFFNDFEQELSFYDGRRAVSSPKNNNSSFMSDTMIANIVNGKGSLKYSPMKDEIQHDAEDFISIQNLESASFYEFRKILSSENYSIGKKVAEFLEDFAANYKSVSESADLLPQPMESVYLLVNELTETFFADFNYGRSETKQMMPFCRASVEKFIFDKVHMQLFGIYAYKFGEETRLANQKIAKIQQDMTCVHQFKYLDIPNKFWLIPSDMLDEEENLTKPLEIHQFPYIDAINEINKISGLKAPREKLGALLMMHSLMKSAVVDFHKGKEEICSMDEELPILIYVLLNSKLENTAAEFNFIDDYVQFDPALESEKRLMTNLKVSLQYIANEWEIKEEIEM